MYKDERLTPSDCPTPGRPPQDSSHVRAVKGEDGNIIRDDDLILQRWREYFADLLNPIQEGAEDTEEFLITGNDLSLDEIFKAVKDLKSEKAAGG